MSDKNPGAPKNLRKQDRATATARTAKNARLRAERHDKRMSAQVAKRIGYDVAGAVFPCDLKVPRGTARNLRRKHLQVAYVKRQALRLV